MDVQTAKKSPSWSKKIMGAGAGALIALAAYTGYQYAGEALSAMTLPFFAEDATAVVRPTPRQARNAADQKYDQQVDSIKVALALQNEKQDLYTFASSSDASVVMQPSTLVASEAVSTSVGSVGSSFTSSESALEQRVRERFEKATREVPATEPAIDSVIHTGAPLADVTHAPAALPGSGTPALIAFASAFGAMVPALRRRMAAWRNRA